MTAGPSMRHAGAGSSLTGVRLATIEALQPLGVVICLPQLGEPCKLGGHVVWRMDSVGLA